MISDATKDNLLLIDILQEASQSGNLVRLRRELENLEYEKDQLQSLINQNVEGQNVLVTAARNGHRKMVQWLIEHGYVLIVPDKVQMKIKNQFSANVESCGSCEFDSDLLENVPALWAASAAGHFTIVQTLVFEGANVNSRTKTNSTPLR